MNELPKLEPEVAAKKVIDDILASPEKEGLAKRAFEEESLEIAPDDEKPTADFQVGNGIVGKVYAIGYLSLDNTPLLEQVCAPLGFAPFYDEGYDNEKMAIDAGVSQMIRYIGRTLRERFDPQYRPKPIELPKSEHELLSDSQRLRQQEGYREPGVRYSTPEDDRAPSCETREIVTDENDVPLVKGVTPRQGMQ
jgi:hypothetical protein